jgi:hypothetical protein
MFSRLSSSLLDVRGGTEQTVCCTFLFGRRSVRISAEGLAIPTESFRDFPTPPKQMSGSRDSSVGIATGYGLDDRGGAGSSSPGRVKNFHFPISSRPALRSTQPPIKWVPGVKRQGREADHSPPTSVEVKKMWIYTSTQGVRGSVVG